MQAESVYTLAQANTGHPKNSQNQSMNRKDRPTNPKKRKKAEERAAFDEDPIHTPWIDSLGITEYESKEQRLHDEIVAFASYIAPTPQEVTARQLVVGRVQYVVRGRFRDSNLSVFGSVAQNLCLPDGDVDAVIRTASVPEARQEKTRALFQLRNALRNAGVSEDIEVVTRAKVPIIHLVTAPQLGSFKIDLSLNEETGVHAIDIINEYLQKMPALRPLVFVLKAFLAQRNLNSAATSGLSSYCLICMTISFLQLNPTARPSDCVTEPMEQESLGILLLDFFIYYGCNFDYKDSVISVSEGKVLSKVSKGWVNPSQPEALSIQCLIHSDVDIGKSATKIEEIKNVFCHAFNTLNDFPFAMQTNWNVLGNVIGLSQKSINHRAHVKQIVDSGALQQTIKDAPKGGFLGNRSQIYNNYGTNRGRGFSRGPKTYQYGTRPPPSPYPPGPLPGPGGPYPPVPPQFGSPYAYYGPPAPVPPGPYYSPPPYANFPLPGAQPYGYGHPLPPPPPPPPPYIVTKSDYSQAHKKRRTGP